MHIQSLVKYFEHQVVHTPNNTALIFANQSLSYHQLNIQSNLLAHHLIGLGLAKNPLIAVVIERSPNMVIALLAILKIGGAYVPIDPDYPADRINNTLIESGADCLLCHRNIMETLSPADDCVVVIADELESSTSSVNNPNIATAADDLAYIIFTSGSTGRPKGVAISHQAVVNTIEDINGRFSVTSQDRVLALSSISFDLSVYDIFGLLAVGGAVVIPEHDRAKEPAHWAELAYKHQITIWDTVPALMQIYTDYLETHIDLRPASLRLVMMSGDWIPLTLPERIRAVCPEADINSLGGATEASIWSICYPIKDVDPSWKSIPYGKALRNQSFHVLDDHLEPCSLMETGHLFIGGIGLALGYWRDKTRTDASFFNHPRTGTRLYRTGDLGRMLPDGNIEFLGRDDFQVKIRGFRIELGEIESVITRHAAIEHAVVDLFGKGDQRGLAAYFTEVKEQEEATIYADGQSHGRVAHWQQIFDVTYEQQVNVDPAFNISGWNSSYNGKPIPAVEMGEWLDATIATIAQQQPQHVLELGCGTGLILFRIVPISKRYTALDLSQQALHTIGEHLRSLDYADQVTLKQGAADQLDHIASASVDTVIINSVVQYFPSLDYLHTVIEKALTRVMPDGVIFIGDLRNYALLEAFHASVQLAHADNDLSLNDLKHRVKLAMQHEEELLVDPDYFYHLQQIYPQISSVDIRLKRGVSHNEMLRFRYDVILHISSSATALKQVDYHDWQQQGYSTHRVKTLLDAKPELLAVGNIPNARLMEATALVAQLTEADGDVAQFCHAFSQEEAGIDPESLCLLAESSRYHCYLLQDGFNTFAVVFQHQSLGNRPCFSLPESHKNKSHTDFANQPYQDKRLLKRQLIAELRQLIAQMLPDYMMPAAFIPMESMPLTANGKVDRKSLPQPEAHQCTAFSALLDSPTEALLATLWCDLLGCNTIDSASGFFDLGGNSLLAMQLVSRIRESFEVELSVRSIFEHHQLHSLATIIETSSGNDPLPPITVQAEHLRKQPSFAQQRLWFLDQFEDHTIATYNIPLSLELHGTLDLAALKQSLHWLLARHSALRCYFVNHDGQPQVAIRDVDSSPLLGIHDLRSLENLDDEVQQRINAHAIASFDLANGPLFKSDLLQLADGKYVLMFNMHHVVSDGWSMVVFLRDWQHAYTAFAHGTQPSKKLIAIEYGDYAVWQRNWLQGEALKRQLDYWQQQLEGIPALLELPTDYPRPAQMSYRGGIYNQSLPDALSGAIASLSQQQGVTIYMTLLAAFNLLLSRYSRQHDICVGSAIAGRSHTHTEGLIGFFVNTLVMRTQLDPAQSFTDLLQATRHTCLSAYAHQDIPFEMLVEQLQPQRSLSHSPLFQVMLVLQNNALFELDLPDLTVNPCSNEHEAAKFDLTLFIEEEHGTFSCGWEYATDLFSAESIMRMSEHFIVLLESITSNPAQAIATLPMLTHDELHQLQRWNAPEKAPLSEQTLLDLFEQQCMQTPNNIALVYEDQKLSYRQLNNHANQLAHHILTSDPCPLIAVLLERSPQMIVAVLAVLKAGAAYVPIDPDYPAQRICTTLESSGANLLISHQHVLDKLDLLDGVRAITVDNLDLSAYSTEKPSIASQADDIAYIIFTSGSTGMPKGVVISHRSAVNTILDINQRFSVTEHDRTLALSSLSFDLSVYDIFGLLAVGGEMVIPPNQYAKEPAYWAKIVHQQGVTLWNSVPALMHIYSDYIAAQNQWQAKSLRLVMMSGDWIPLTLPERIQTIAPQATLISLGGATEAAIWSIYYPINSVDPSWKSIPYGKPLRNQSFQVLDDALEPCPLFVPGHLYIGGAGLAQGYWRDTEKTAKSFIIHPKTSERRYRTGDLGRYLADGNIEFLGRDDFQVKIRGFRIELGDIEATLRGHGDVKEVLVTVDGEGDHRCLVAYVSGVKRQGAGVGELGDWLKARLPEYMLPTHIMMLDSFPLTANGKIDRKTLPRPETKTDLTVNKHPFTATETLLATLWNTLLGCGQLGRDDHFFDLGGHSLLAMQLVSRIRETFAVELPVRNVFEYPQLRTLATAIEAGRGSIKLPPIIVQSNEARQQLSFAQQRLWFLDQLEQQSSATYNIPMALRLSGDLHIDALEQSLYYLLLRHGSLRSYFIKNDGQPQVAQLGIDAITPLHRHHPMQQNELNNQLNQLAITPFDLAHGPLFRADLLTLDEQNHLLMINMHHTISDAWSLGVLLRDLQHAYCAFIANQKPDLPPLNIEYGDYAIWQRNWLQGDELKRQVDYWQHQLADAPELLELPTDKIRPAQQRYRGAYHSHQLSTELSGRIKALSREHHTTLFMTVLAAFNVLLARYSRQNDLCVGSPIANRNHNDIEDMVGFFVNTLVLRCKMKPEASFTALLQQTRETCLAAYAHQDIPFEMLVEALQPTRSMSHAPLFQVMLVVQNEMPSITLPSLNVELVAADYPIAKFDVTLFVVEKEDGLHCGWEYATDLFTAESMARMGEHFTVLLESITSNPAQTIASLPMLTHEELQQLKSWNAPEKSAISDCTLLDLFEQQVVRTPDNIAIIYKDQSLSYHQLNNQANQLAHHILTADPCTLTSDTLIAVSLERSPIMIIAVFAVLKTGAAYVPIDPDYPADRISRTLESSGCRCLITHQHALLKLKLTTEVTAVIVEQLDLSALSSKKPHIESRPDDLAYVIFTSGSTGTPKGVMVSHRSVVNTIVDINQRFEVTAKDAVLAISSLSFDLSVYDVFGLLAVGGRIVIPPNDMVREPDYWAKVITQHSISLWNSVPALMLIYTDYMIDQQQKNNTLRLVMMSGDWIPLSLPERIQAACPQTKQMSLGGSTEASIWSAYHPIHQLDPAWRSIPYGKPLRNQSFYVLDKSLSPCPIMVAGHLYIGGIGLARGYWRDAVKTAASFIIHPETGQRFYKSGDLGRFLPDGSIEFLGRDDFQVKIRGFRIELGDIESCLRQHPNVKEPLVTVQGEGNNQQLVGYVTVVRGQGSGIREEGVRISELHDWLRDRLPAYMLPSYLMVLDAFPLTANGKIDRKALPTPERTLSRRFEAPRNDVEQTLADIWAALLGQASIGIDDNFFELGGDSILSIQVIARARQAGIHLAVHQMFEFQSIAALASVAQQGSMVTMDAEQGMVGGSLPLTPVQHWFFRQKLPELNHFNQSVLLSVPDDLNIDALQLAFAAVLAQHDALRLRFVCVDGIWQQDYANEIADIPFIVADGSQNLVKQSLAWQQSLDVDKSPLTRMVLFQHSDHPMRLFWCIHHLAVDGVSWRPLLEDLYTAYSQYAQNQPLLLPAKTTSYKAWSEHLQHYLHDEVLAAELPYWQALSIIPLPMDFADGRNHREYQHDVTVCLSEDETNALLREAPAAYNSRINDLLLAALAMALADWTGESQALIELEGHGRNNLFEAIDLSRSVGWFTTMYPVMLTLPPEHASQSGAVIKSVKEQLRSTPNDGIGYGLLRELADHALPRADILFNYLGQFDQGIDAGDFHLLNEDTGSAIAMRGSRSHLIEINGAINKGQLSLSWSYSGDCYRAETIEKLTQSYLSHLQTLIKHCQQGRQGVTPSDFSAVSLGQQTLDTLYHHYPLIEDVYPLTPMQQGLLFHSIYDHKSVVYFEQLLCTISHLDVGLFKAAWQQQLERHSILRSAFLIDLEPMLQLVQGRVELHWTEHDWRSESPNKQDEQLHLLTDKARKKGFDLTQAPLIRFDLIRMDDTRYTFVMHFHHVLLDGWSVSHIFKEVHTSYLAMKQGQALQRPTSPPFRGYIDWLLQQDGNRADDYWQQRMAGFESATVLPIQQHNNRQPDYLKVHYSLDAERSAELQQFCRQQRVTLNTLLQAALGLLLARYSGSKDICFGVTISGRHISLRGIETMVGMTINSIPLRLKLDVNQSVADFLLAVQHKHQSDNRYGYHSLIDIHKNSALPKEEKLFDTLLAVENYPRNDDERASGDGYRIDQMWSEHATNFPLTIMVDPDDTIDFYMLYDKERLSGESIHRLWQHLGMLLSACMNHPDQAIGSLPMLTEPELAQLQRWNAPEKTAILDCTLLDLFEQQVVRTPDNIAIIYKDQSLSYRQLNNQANQLAHHILTAEPCTLTPDTLIAVSLERSPIMIIAVLAVLKTGAAYVPIDPDYPADRISRTLESSGCRCLITHQHALLKLKLTTEITTVIVEQLDLSALSSKKPHIEHRPDDLAYVIFTSGSTGTPKGVMVSHRSVVNTIVDINQRFEVTAKDAVLAISSLSFDLSVYDVFGLLAVGGKIVIPPNDMVREPDYWAKLMAQHSISLWNSVPALMLIYTDYMIDQQQQNNTLRLVMMSGDWIPLSLPERIQEACPQTKKISLGGATEASIWSIYHPIHQLDPSLRSIPYGKPLRNQSFYVLDESLSPCPIMVAGHLYIGGIGLARGYWRDAEKTAASFIIHPKTGQRLYKSGDVGRYLPDGNIEFLGRDDFQVKVRGYRIELGDIEAALCRHPQIKGATVIVHEDDNGQRLLGYYTVQVSKENSTQRESWFNVTNQNSEEAVIIDFDRHHFPSIDDLVAVLEKTITTIVPHGKIIMQNIPNLQHLEAFHTAEERQKADDKLPPDRLNKRIQAAIEQEERLFIDPEFFQKLQSDFPSIIEVQTLLKRGNANNEEDGFRYDVTVCNLHKIT